MDFHLFDPDPTELGQDSNQNCDTLVKCEDDPRVSDVNFTYLNMDIALQLGNP